MKGFRADDPDIYTNTDWFVAKITDVGDKFDDTSNYPCSWQVYNFNNEMQSIDEDDEGLLYGDFNIDYNTAYPISQTIPAIGDVVLMRFRGTYEEQNIFEFIFGGFSYPELALTAIQCSGDILTKTFSTGCVYQP
jgi:hypothetical protein